MRLDIRYVTRFTYHQPVRESSNELRACPTTDDRQQLVSYRVITVPFSRIHTSVDHWGTRVDAFGIREPHTELEVVAEAAVETEPAAAMTATPPLAALQDAAFRDAHAEYLQPTVHSRGGEAVDALAAELRAQASDDVTDLVFAVHEIIGHRLRYVTGSTEVGIDLEEVLQRAEGVCQDYAHLFVALCRSLHIPARYVSGYLYTVDDSTGADAEVDEVRVQTHAWGEAAIPGAGWWALDPTNRQDVSERHVKIGHGRDYDDVQPLKGAFSGPPAHDLEVEVAMRRLTAAQQQQQ